MTYSMVYYDYPFDVAYTDMMLELSFTKVGRFIFFDIFMMCDDDDKGNKIEELIHLYILAGGKSECSSSPFNPSKLIDRRNLLIDCAKILETI